MLKDPFLALILGDGRRVEAKDGCDPISIFGGAYESTNTPN